MQPASADRSISVLTRSVVGAPERCSTTLVFVLNTIFLAQTDQWRKPAAKVSGME
jgi:hypothetical protein